MDTFLLNRKLEILITAIMCIGLGVALIVYPQMSTSVICYAIGGILIACAVFHVFLYFKFKKENSVLNFNLIIAISVGVIGLWILLNPTMVIMIIPIIFGIILIVHGIIDLKQSFELKEKYYRIWWSAIVVAIINFFFGGIVLLTPFSSVKALVVLIGVSLIYDGISDIWIITRISKATRDMKKSLDTINQE